MQEFKLQIVDLEPNQSDIEQKITDQEAAKIVGGSNNIYECDVDCDPPEHPGFGINLKPLLGKLTPYPDLDT